MKSLWIDYTENPEAISSLYSSAEPLCNVTPYKLILEQTPLEASLYLFVNTPPDRPTPIRWPKNTSGVSIQLGLFFVSDLLIECWDSSTTAKISIQQLGSAAEAKRITVAWQGGMKAFFTARVLRIQSITHA